VHAGSGAIALVLSAAQAAVQFVAIDDVVAPARPEAVGAGDRVPRGVAALARVGVEAVRVVPLMHYTFPQSAVVQPAKSMVAFSSWTKCRCR
jgi:hypothetical protein